jgi:DNA-binding transcriptional LysR family regulator
MDIRHLRYFVAVAETLHFGRAAQNLHMSQPPLSKRIADLEGELSVPLFDRSKRQVALTAAGRALLPRARAALRSFEAALRAVRAEAPAKSRRIHVAFPADTSAEVLLDLVNELRPGDVEINVAEATTAEQHQLLVAGELDIGVLRHPYPTRGLWSSQPLRQTLGVVLPSTHELARRGTLRLADLKASTLVMFPRSMAPGLYDDILKTCRAEGYVPKRIRHAVRMTAGLMIAEPAVTFRTVGFRVPGPDRVAPELIWKPLIGEPLHWWTSVVCRRNERDPLTRLAIQVMLRALQQHDHWVPGTVDRGATRNDRRRDHDAAGACSAMVA